jgi:GTPase
MTTRMYDITYDTEFLPPEPEKGNIEYKLRIKNDPTRLIGLATQMRWRLAEGYHDKDIYEALYYIGVHDKGKILNVSDEILEESVINFKKICGLCPAKIVDLKKFKTKAGKIICIRIHKKIDVPDCVDMKILNLGNTNVGKTTFIATLTHDAVDNGKGSARLSVLRHPHELIEGKSSSISLQFIGYKENQHINTESGISMSWIGIQEESDKIINLIDLPGDTKYQRLRLETVLNYCADMVFIFIDGTNIDTELDDMLKYCEICTEINQKFSIIITKIDLLSEHEIEEVNMTVKGAIIDSTSNKAFDITDESINIFDNTIDTIPILMVSNLDKKYAMLTHKFINKISQQKSYEHTNDNDVMFYALDVFYKYDIGEIIVGILKNGRIKVGNTLTLGQEGKDIQEKVKILSIQKKQVPYQRADESPDILALTIDKITDKNRHIVLTNGTYDDIYTDVIHIKLNDKYIGKFKPTKNPVCAFIGNYCGKVDVLDTPDNGKYLVVKIPNTKVISIINSFVIIKKYSELFVGTIIP